MLAQKNINIPKLNKSIVYNKSCDNEKLTWDKYVF